MKFALPLLLSVMGLAACEPAPVVNGRPAPETVAKVAQTKLAQPGTATLTLPNQPNSVSRTPEVRRANPIPASGKSVATTTPKKASAPVIIPAKVSGRQKLDSSMRQRTSATAADSAIEINLMNSR